MLTIGKTYRFAASHTLRTLPATHKCSRLHGHNYRVTLTLVTLDGTAGLEHGMLVDYAELDTRFGGWLRDQLDHRDLNQAFGDDYEPTAERLAETLFTVAVGLFPGQVLSVRVQETDDTFAEWGR